MREEHRWRMLYNAKMKFSRFFGPNFGPNSVQLVETRCNERIADFAEMLGNIDYSEPDEISRNNVCTLSRPVP
jgi:hypothetical protein